MEFQDVVRRRRMVRTFDGRPLPPEVVERILANGARAPSAGFTQGWAFLVLEGPEETGRFWAASAPPDGNRARTRWPGVLRAPLLVVVLADEGAYRRRYAEPDKAASGLADGPWSVPYWPVGAVAVGHPLPDEPSPSLARGRRPLEDVVHRGRW